MRYGVCAPYREVTALETYPFDFVEEHVQNFLLPERPEEDFEEVWREARTLPVPIEAARSLFPADLVLVETPTQPVDRKRLERYVKTVLQRAERVGIRIIVFGSGGARICPPGYSHDDAVRQIGNHFAQWDQWAENHGVQIVLEHLPADETNMLNTVTEAGKLLASMGKSDSSLLIDVYHMSRNHEPPESILPWGPLISHVHVAEVQQRAAPGRFGQDFRPYFSILHQVGYDRRISIECNWQNFAIEVNPAIETLREQWMTSAEPT
jgi:sugar phosphate isomerase/epimerase